MAVSVGLSVWLSVGLSVCQSLGLLVCQPVGLSVGPSVTSMSNSQNPRLFHQNKARYMATEVACGWAGAIFEVTKPFGQEQ